MGTTNFDSVAANGQTLNPKHYDVINFFISGAQTTGTTKAGALIPYAGTITDVRAYLDTAPTGSTFIVDIHKSGTTIFTTQGSRPTVAISGNASTTTAPDVTSVAVGDRLTLDIDQIGSSVAGSGLYVAVSIKRANVT
jgi:hypothetical protein